MRSRMHSHMLAHMLAHTQPEYFLAEEQLSGLTSSLRFGASGIRLQEHCMHTYTTACAHTPLHAHVQPPLAIEGEMEGEGEGEGGRTVKHFLKVYQKGYSE